MPAGYIHIILHLNLRSQSISICIRNEKISGCKIWESCLKLTFMTHLPFLNKRKSKFYNQTKIAQKKHHTQFHKMNPAQMIFKVWFSPSKKYCVICFIESPLKMMKNTFYFNAFEKLFSFSRHLIFYHDFLVMKKKLLD